jgi:hypothetical protein
MNEFWNENAGARDGRIEGASTGGWRVALGVVCVLFLLLIWN